jgi:hypothetical protein
MNALKTVPLAILVAGTVALGGCAAVAGGAAGSAAGYEYSNKRAIDELEADYEAGRITKDEYQLRREEIDKRSVVE